MRRRLALALAAAAAVAGALLLLWLGEADARPGGGHSYSGGGGFSGGGGYSGGGSSGGGSSSGGGELIYLLVRLIIEAPQIGVPVAAALIGGYIWFKRQTSADAHASWDSVALLVPPPPPAIEQIRQLDPQFSVVLFEDFLFRLYSQAHRVRHDATALAALAPYLSRSAREHLAARVPDGAPAGDVVIGSLRTSQVLMPPRLAGPDGVERFASRSGDGRPYYVKVTVEIEANMTVVAAGKETTYYVREQWTLGRDAAAHSRPLGRARTFDCPNCGAPFQSSDEQTCAHCGEVVATGRFDWMVGSIALLHQETRPPLLGGYSPEVGTWGETITHPRLDFSLAALRRDDPAFTDEAMASRLTRIYTELNAGWSEQDLARIRPFVSDGMYDYLRYWIAAYRRQKLINRLEGMKMTGWRYAKVTRDAHYDAITVRLWATGRDFTVHAESGAVVGGSRSTNRDYSEYWTLVRGASVRGAPRSDRRCPNCGADLKISMAGSCEYCQVHVTSGEFDWVLSKIEQDEAYRG